MSLRTGEYQHLPATGTNDDRHAKTGYERPTPRQPMAVVVVAATQVESSEDHLDAKNKRFLLQRNYPVAGFYAGCDPSCVA